MECNKEEAVRAKDIALKKMQDKDFVVARKFALKAQQLYPDMENISQMICVCDVHCSAENKMFGNELDWYGILQIEQTADDILIRKQYRKFALLLHPDKNQFAGAEAAFKLIGEAQRGLLDREKRSLYDMKRRPTYKPVIPTKANRSSNVGRQSRVQDNFTPPQQEQKQPAQSGVANGRGTFWTQCPFCAVRCQCHKEALNVALNCQGCKKSFNAYDMHGQGARRRRDVTRPVFPQGVANVGTSKARSEATNDKPASNAGFPEFDRFQRAKQPHKVSSKVDRVGSPGSSRKVNGKRGKKQVVESSEDFESDSSRESEGIEMQANGDNLRTRRSSRNKQHVSYNEIVSDDEETVNPSKRAKGKTDASEKEHLSNHPHLVGSVFASIDERRKPGCCNSEGSESLFESVNKSYPADDNGLNSSPQMIPETTFVEYPDPEFSDFDKNREEDCFKVGQLWAAYDTVDAMPRFYARIMKIFSPRFKLRITWLEPHPDDEVGKEWANSEMPFSCGKFKYGNSENTEDRLMFSHEVAGDIASGKDSFKIYPKKGETWAIFKNWDAKWYIIPEENRKFEYEFVEILSEYDETVGIRVAHLGKLKGFASLFGQKDGNEVQIPPAEILTFSHRVPSYRMTGDERKDVPRGSFELDPASITMNLEEIALPKLDGKTRINDFSSKYAEENPSLETAEKSAPIYQNNEKGNEVDHGNHLDGNVNGHNIPNPEFHNFQAMKSVDNFQVNQVWALYNDIDGSPKYYGLVKKIDHHPSFKLHIAKLQACYLPTDMICWKDKMMPISCGQFKIKGAKVQTYTSTSPFSHQLRIELTKRKNMFSIYPHDGEVWALYKNWNSEMRVVDLKNCDYDIVEVMEENDSHIRVLDLERVHGFNSVFKPQKNGNFPSAREIPLIELLRFSHQIPSFRLTDEKGGSLRGFWELDPRAFPPHVLCK